jgi:hypothetical protein
MSFYNLLTLKIFKIITKNESHFEQMQVPLVGRGEKGYHSGT